MYFQRNAPVGCKRNRNLPRACRPQKKHPKVPQPFDRPHSRGKTPRVSGVKIASRWKALGEISFRSETAASKVKIQCKQRVREALAGYAKHEGCKEYRHVFGRLERRLFQLTSQRRVK